MTLSAFVATPPAPGVDGWTNPVETWVYASATTLTVPNGALYQAGDLLKLTNSTVKYFVVVSISSNTLTITGGTDYTLANAAITANFYSRQDAPLGFPSTFAYTPTVTASVNTITSVAASMRFKLSRHQLWFAATIVVTTNGTASTIMQMTLPGGLTAKGSQQVGTGYNANLNVVLRPTTTDASNLLNITNADGTYPGADGRTLYVTGLIEVN